MARWLCTRIAIGPHPYPDSYPQVLGAHTYISHVLCSFARQTRFCSAATTVSLLVIYTEYIKSRQKINPKWTYLENGRFPRSLSSATYSASVVRHQPMSAGRLNAAILRRGAYLSVWDDLITLLVITNKDCRSYFPPCQNRRRRVCQGNNTKIVLSRLPGGVLPTSSPSALPLAIVDRVSWCVVLVGVVR